MLKPFGRPRSVPQYPVVSLLKSGHCTGWNSIKSALGLHSTSTKGVVLERAWRCSHSTAPPQSCAAPGLPSPLGATCTPASSPFPASKENSKHVLVLMSWFCKCPVSLHANNLWCFTSTLSYLLPAKAVADVHGDRHCAVGASSCPDLVGLVLPLLWCIGVIRSHLDCFPYGQNPCCGFSQTAGCEPSDRHTFTHIQHTWWALIL